MLLMTPALRGNRAVRSSLSCRHSYVLQNGALYCSPVHVSRDRRVFYHLMRRLTFGTATEVQYRRLNFFVSKERETLHGVLLPVLAIVARCEV